MTRADRPPGRDTRDGRALTPPGRPPDARSSLKGSDRSVPSGADSGRDLDADLSVIRGSVDDLGVWTGIWEARREPDAFARRCASDAIDAADNLLAAAHRIRARLIGEVRQADDATAARVDALLARTRDDSRP